MKKTVNEKRRIVAVNKKSTAGARAGETEEKIRKRKRNERKK